MSPMDVEYPGSETVISDEVFTVALLEQTPTVPRGAVRNPCRWLALFMLLLEPAIFVVMWCTVANLLPHPGL